MSSAASSRGVVMKRCGVECWSHRWSSQWSTSRLDKWSGKRWHRNVVCPKRRSISSAIGL
ncbi:hypothetical protein [Crateriforma conspicua]|uniref:hypothetical protein n=1 Tax=Crateriforma TaxID=2714592 RepID=UPI0039658252